MVTTKGVRVASGNLCEAEAPTEATAETKPEITEENIMNAKTERQIENLKKQTIGVEIEMNHITRERAARLAADHFGTGRYKYTASRNGYSTWSAWDAQGREWKFQKDVSIAGCDAEKCELVTPILKYEDIETLQELVRKLHKAGAISHAGIGAGVHIHIGANGHTPQTLRNLANLMASHERLIADALKIDQGRMNRYCRTVNPQFIEQLNRKKPTNMAQFADIWYTANGANYGRNQHYNDSRYHMLNYHATFTKGTIEFRLFQIRQACQRQEKRTSCRTAEKLHTTLPCPFRNGKGTANSQPETTANGKPEIRHAYMADPAGTGRRGVRHCEKFSYQEP